MANSKVKVCYMLSYKSPGYIRTRVLVAALSKINNLELSTAINSNRSILRYPQTLWRLLVVRLTQRPNIYILGFRGQEIYWPVRLLTAGRPLIFDEFINMHDWLGDENNKLPQPLIKLADWYETTALKTCRIILADTKLGAKSSSRAYNIPLNKYRTIYVGADEQLFYPVSNTKNKPAKNLEVLFYGNMAPLHGIDVILAAAKQLKDKPIRFTIVGGKGKPATVKGIKNYIRAHSLKNVSYTEWVDFKKIPRLITHCDIFLGGPFGNTSQSQRVITGKTYQALATGIATVVGTIKEDVGFIDKQNCLLVQQGSAKDLASQIAWADNNRYKLASIGANGRTLYEKKFSLQTTSQQLSIILSSTLTTVKEETS